MTALAKQDTQERVPCTIYKSRKKMDTYIYVPRGFDIKQLPAGLLSIFGEPEFVFDLELYIGRTLAQEDVVVVMRNLQQQGYHLQMPQREYMGSLQPF